VRRKGILTKWNDDRGFGFITSSGGEEPVFVHISAFARGQERPVLNRSLTYRLVRDEKQRPRAADVRFMVSRRRPARQKSRGLIPAALVVAAFFGGLAALVPPPEWQRLAGFYTLGSVATFLFWLFVKESEFIA
jgi:cold shock CspA family protein